jgi:hypothetical protein
VSRGGGQFWARGKGRSYASDEEGIRQKGTEASRGEKRVGVSDETGYMSDRCMEEEGRR